MHEFLKQSHKYVLQCYWLEFIWYWCNLLSSYSHIYMLSIGRPLLHPLWQKRCTKNNSACIYRLPLIMYQYMSTIIERVFVYGIFFLVSVKNANTTLSHLLSVDMLPCCCNIWVGSPVIFVDSQLYLNKWQDPRSGQPCNQWKYLLLVISMYLIKQFSHSVISTSTACIVKYL